MNPANNSGYRRFEDKEFVKEIKFKRRKNCKYVAKSGNILELIPHEPYRPYGSFESKILIKDAFDYYKSYAYSLIGNRLYRVLRHGSKGDADLLAMKEKEITGELLSFQRKTRHHIDRIKRLIKEKDKLNKQVIVRGEREVHNARDSSNIQKKSWRDIQCRL